MLSSSLSLVVKSVSSDVSVATPVFFFYSHFYKLRSLTARTGVNLGAEGSSAGGGSGAEQREARCCVVP